MYIYIYGMREVMWEKKKGERGRKKGEREREERERESLEQRFKEILVLYKYY